MSLRHFPALVATVLIASCGGGTTATRTDGDSTKTSTGRTSTIPGYTEFYRLVRFNALEQIVFCYPTSDPRGEGDVVGVARDAEGRPTMITRFFFGNPENRAEWTSMRIEYTYYPSTATMVERRTYLDPSGAPLEVRGAWGYELQYKKGDRLSMRRIIDQNGKPIINVRQVIRSLYKEERPGTIVQEWFFGNGKQYFGIGTDDPGRPFGDMPPEAYFRRYTVNERGDLVREEVWGIDKTAMPYSGGEMVRAYELNDCGQATQILYLDLNGRSRVNIDGIAREQLEYDDHGRLVKWQSFGETGVPHARSIDGAAAIVYRYREFDGVLVGIELFDANGDPIASPQATPTQRRE
jgi:hypothetical protein